MDLRDISGKLTGVAVRGCCSWLTVPRKEFWGNVPSSCKHHLFGGSSLILPCWALAAKLCLFLSGTEICIWTSWRAPRLSFVTSPLGNCNLCQRVILVFWSNFLFLALGTPARHQVCATEVGEPRSGNWSTRDLPGPRNIKRWKSPRYLHLKAKTQLHSTTSKLQCWTPYAKQLARQEYNPIH